VIEERRDRQQPDLPAPDKIVQAQVLRTRPHPHEPKKPAKPSEAVES